CTRIASGYPPSHKWFDVW
nr:immunoglobulin heavy chain junction region [Macaca mulatta]MOX15623.1 immunoglobulin heavy chain junction region [Macaca mulatta]MOX15788.1 immunoglobulin heavy chain junction region [Macaca mulatta]MOX16145.1 immunoglobulin heavy chain junction region [Macaca mulatta]MOX16531.1 immunoglobulin heavy chain junction region [Macaca mulatta]